MSIKIYFGVPGSGKTTLAAKIVMDNLKRGVKTFTNVPIKGGLLFDASDLGLVDISDGEMVLDEAGIQFNNRKFKTLPQSTIEWFKLSRHYGIRNIHIFSQSYDDMDITLRRLADEIYVIKRSLIPFVFSKRRIKVKVGIDKDTHQIMDQYFFQFLGINTYVGYHFWHMFDSWSAPILSERSWYYSSFDSFTIDSKHSKLIYKSLKRQGKLWFKLFSLLKKLFDRKNIFEKSSRIKHACLSRLSSLFQRARKNAKGEAETPKSPTSPQFTTEEWKAFFKDLDDRQRDASYKSIVEKEKSQVFDSGI